MIQTPRRQVYFNEFNLLMGDATYLPLVSGILRAYAETSPEILANYDFAPFLFHIDTPEAILARYDEPAVAAFSISMWNEQLSLHVAREVKRRWPDCKIVVGGPQVPHKPEAYFSEHDFVDVAVRGEGEESFAETLLSFIGRHDLKTSPGVSFRTDSGEFFYNPAERAFHRDLDVYPSPYLEGLYDELMAANPQLNFQAIVETNRGCPFKCTFCYWGKDGLSRKYRYHGQDRLAAEIEWIGRRKIRYVFNADSNFGMHRRDMEIAQMLVATKQKFGFPEKFRTCYGKNTDEKIFAIGSLFHEHQLEKGITMSYQSRDEKVQENIKRSNIKLEVATHLQTRFNDSDVPVYVELILGLPGETTESWMRGIDEILGTGLKNQLFVYICQIFPNTELADPDYRARFGIRSKRIELREIHGSVRSHDWVPEYEDIVVATDSMPAEDWRRMLVLSWMTMLIHSLKLGFFVLAYLVDRFPVRHSEFLAYLAEGRFPQGVGEMLRSEVATFDEKVEALRAGEGRGCVMPEFGGIYWDEEEASFLRLSRDFNRFYDEFHGVVAAFLDEQGIAFDADELAEVIRYQRLRVPTVLPSSITSWRFRRNMPEYFDTRFGSEPKPLALTPQTLLVSQPDYGGEPERYGRETILWGRKSGLMLTHSDYEAA